MAVINSIISESNFELVRTRIATILVDEYAEQRILNQAALDAELAKPIIDQDPVLIASLELNLSALPTKVWEERFKRPQPKEYIDEPVVNVIFTNAPLNENQTVSTQIGDDTFVIEVYTGIKEPPEETPVYDGDSKASIRLQRCLAISRAILMNPQYQTLGFSLGIFIGKVSANNIQIGQPDDGADNGNNLIRGKFDLIVKIGEEVEQITGVALTLNETTVKLYDEEKGYFWTNESN